MTKKEIVRIISEQLGVPQQQTKEVVQLTLDTIVELLRNEGRLELRNFGVFEVKRRGARSARNPRTGDSVDVPERWVVTFKPGKEMEQSVGEAAARRQSGRSGPPQWVLAASTDGRPAVDPPRQPS